MEPQGEYMAWRERAVATVKAHACDILRNSLNEIECMHKFVLEIIYSNYLKNVRPSIHISILFNSFLTSPSS